MLSVVLLPCMYLARGSAWILFSGLDMVPAGTPLSYQAVVSTSRRQVASFRLSDLS
jgi:hypothetical protein